MLWGMLRRGDGRGMEGGEVGVLFLTYKLLDAEAFASRECLVCTQKGKLVVVIKMVAGGPGNRTQCLSHAKRSLYHMS